MGFQNSKTLNEKIAFERSQQNAALLRLAFSNETEPVLTAINTLALSDLSNRVRNINQIRWVSMINIIMRYNPSVISVYLGFDTGNSFFIRQLKSLPKNKRFGAPDNATLMIEMNQSNHAQTRIFFDDALNKISESKGQTQFDATQRPWYQNAISSDKVYYSPPYQFYFLDIIGISLSRRLMNNNGVIAMDISLKSLNAMLGNLRFSDNSLLLLLDQKKNIIANYGKGSDGILSNEIPSIKASSPFSALLMKKRPHEMNQMVEFRDKAWQLSVVKINTGNQNLYLAEAIPRDELIQPAIAARNHQIVLTIIMLVLGFGLTVWGANRIAEPLKQLNHATRYIRHLNFRKTQFPASDIKQINDLSSSMEIMSTTISSFLTTLHNVAQSPQLDTLLNDIVSHCYQTAKADFVLLWTDNPDTEQGLSLAAYQPTFTDGCEIQLSVLLDDLSNKSASSNDQNVITFNAADIDEKANLPAELVRGWLFPLLNRNTQCIGYVFIGFHRSLTQQEEEKIQFIQTFLDFVSLIKENRFHLVRQKRLFDAIIHMFASAIDTKSPHTGAHCQRVPVLTFLLAEAVSQDERYFPDYNLNETRRESLHLAAWLHDCGKVTTPDFVVDKATKLETRYNRIHEIRTRYEVLKRDAIIASLDEQLRNPTDDQIQSRLNKMLIELDEEFAFVAQCNLGTEKLSADCVARLDAISQQRWWQPSMDDTIGLSWEETDRLKNDKSTQGQKISVLYDKKRDVIEWTEKQQKAHQNWDFSLTVPEHQLNIGELNNLKITRGTLSTEERFITNLHIITTIQMLKKLPFPQYLEDVPQIAAGHHEKLDGSGYPYGLTKDELSVDARIMAIADIFEALTAHDRPYKKAKTLSESLYLLAMMAKNKHIDADLYRLFVEQDVYAYYADLFLSDEQRDKENIDKAYLLSLLT